MLFPILFLVDQISKYMIREKGGFYICNKGVAFGIRLPEILIYIFAIVLFLYFIISNYKCRISNQFQSSKSKKFVTWIWELICHWKFDIWILLIISGAASNIIDRIYFGCVIDFIDLKIWPVFNIADIYITIGGTMLIYLYVFKGSFGSDNRSSQ